MCYRWHARFALSPKQEPLWGQMVDVSSTGMALLYHNDKSCPGPDQLITTSFGVPYFDAGDSFDTVFFNRTGHVCRVDNLTSKVNRIAIQFAEPLFFKPGHQDISDSDAKQRLEAKARLIASSKTKTERKANAEEIPPLYSESLAGAEERIRAYAEAKVRAEEKAKAETRARVKAEAKARTEVKLRTKAEKKAEAEAQKRTRIEAELLKKAGLHAEQLAKIKADAAREIARIKAESKAGTHKKKTAKKRNQTSKTRPSGEGILMDRVDKFITSRNRIF